MVSAPIQIVGRNTEIPIGCKTNQPLNLYLITETVGLMFKTHGVLQIPAQVPVSLAAIGSPVQFHGSPELHGYLTWSLWLYLIAQVAADPRPDPFRPVGAVQATVQRAQIRCFRWSCANNLVSIGNAEVLFAYRKADQWRNAQATFRQDKGITGAKG